jgi:hypothetical protein
MTPNNNNNFFLSAEIKNYHTAVAQLYAPRLPKTQWLVAEPNLITNNKRRKAA